MLQKGRHIGTITSVIDLENLSYQKHYYWPGITVFREVSYRATVLVYQELLLVRDILL